MSVHLRKDGRWVVCYRHPETRKHTTEYFGRGPDAERRARKRNEELRLARHPPRLRSPLFAELAVEYGKAKSPGWTKASADAWLYKMHSIILPELGHRQAAGIDADCLDGYVRKRLADPIMVRVGKKKKPLTDRDGCPRRPRLTTIHRELSDVLAVLRWGVRRGYLAMDPAAGYELPARDDEVIAPPTMAELHALLASSPPHLIRFLIVSYSTGARPGPVEVFGIRWSDVDLDTCRVLIRSARKGANRQGRPQFRAVPIQQRLAEVMAEWRRSDELLAAEIERPVEHVIHWRGRPIRSIKRAFATAKEKAAITRRLRPYDFRHLFTTLLLDAGAELRATSEIIGHSRTDTTSRIYHHTTPASHRAAIEFLPELPICGTGQQIVVCQDDRPEIED